MVAAARTAAPGTAPVSASTPLGTSTASVRAAGAHSASRAAAGRSPPLPPMPTIPSSTRSAAASTLSSPGSPASRMTTPLRRAAAAPASCSRADTANAVTAAPRVGEPGRREQRVAAVVAAADEHGDPRAVHLSGNRRRAAAASPAAARCMSAPSGSGTHQLVLGGADGRQPGERCACVRPSRPAGQLSRMTTAIAIPPSWLSETCHDVAPRRAAASATVPRSSRWGAPSLGGLDLGVLPAQPGRRAERLGDAPPSPRTEPPAAPNVRPPVRPRVNSRSARPGVRSSEAWNRSTSTRSTPSPTITGSSRCASLDGDGLGQVARLVDVQAAGQRQLAGEDLQRQGGDQRGKQGRRVRHPDQVGRVRDDRARRPPRR